MSKHVAAYVVFFATLYVMAATLVAWFFWGHWAAFFVASVIICVHASKAAADVMKR